MIYVDSSRRVLNSFIDDLTADVVGESGRDAPDAWDAWLRALFPSHVAAGFADHHRDFWQHVDSIRKGDKPRPFVAIWPRGGGKSTGCELATVYLTARQKRRYVWYVRETQDQADASVENIAALLESPQMELHYPPMARRKVGKYGNSKGWRRQRLRTEWATIDALGLDKAARGSRVEEDRPDLIIFDDVDGITDSTATTEKKETIITKSLLPAGSNDCAVIFVQNVIHADSVAARLCGVADRSAEYMADRIVSGPHPAVIGLETEPETLDDGRIIHRIIAGKAIWSGQDIETCQQQINEWGISSFMTEAQHDVADSPDALWSRDLLNETRVAAAPDLFTIVVAIDPAASTGQTGIVVAGAGRIDGITHGYVLADWSPPYGAKPNTWATAAVEAYHHFGADVLVGEVNNGGDMIEETIRNVEGGRGVYYETVRASRGKHTRAQPVSAAAEEGRWHMVGQHPELEKELRTWVPGDDSPNRLDAMVWAAHKLGIATGRPALV